MVVGLIFIGCSKNGVGRWEKDPEDTEGFGWRCFERRLIKREENVRLIMYALMIKIDITA